MDCKKCIHNEVCQEIENLKCRKDFIWYKAETGCPHYTVRNVGVWQNYSTTMMECSVCGRHTARHRFEYCPHCGAKMVPKIQMKEDKPEYWEQLTIFDLNTGENT